MGTVVYRPSSQVVGDVDIVGDITASGTINTVGISSSADSTALTIDVNENIGIGELAPDYRLHVNSGAVGEVALFESLGAFTDILFADSGTLAGQVRLRSLADGLAIIAGGVERLRITSSGGVGIGTTNPDGSLHVMTASAGTVTANVNADDLVVENSADGGISILTPNSDKGYLVFGSPSDDFAASVLWDAAVSLLSISTNTTGGEMRFRTDNGTEAMRITSSGKVGIGTATPSGILHTLSADVGLKFQASQLTTKRMQFFFQDNAGVQTGRIGVDISGANTSTLQFLAGSGGTPQMTITSAGVIQVSGDTIRVQAQKTPASATATGVKGDIVHDASYIYVCTATNVWKRSAIATW